MRQKKHIWEKCYAAGANLRKKAESVGVLRLFVDIAENFQELCGKQPEIVLEEKENAIWLVYPDLSWEVESLVEEYGAELATISARFPMLISGMTSRMDMGTVEISWDDQNQICCRKSNFKGTDFERLESLGLKIRFDKAETLSAYGELVKGIRMEYPYAPVSRKHIKYLEEGTVPENAKKDTYYYYIPVNPQSERFFADGLSIRQKQNLWLKFLKDGVSPMEFAYINQALAEGTEVNMFELELALRMAMASEGITIEYRDVEFRILDKNGQRKWFSYQSVLEAEKLCVKILFPEIPVKNR